MDAPRPLRPATAASPRPLTCGARPPAAASTPSGTAPPPARNRGEGTAGSAAGHAQGRSGSRSSEPPARPAGWAERSQAQRSPWQQRACPRRAVHAAFHHPAQPRPPGPLSPAHRPAHRPPAGSPPPHHGGVPRHGCVPRVLLAPSGSSRRHSLELSSPQAGWFGLGVPHRVKRRVQGACCCFSTWWSVPHAAMNLFSQIIES